MTLDPLPAPPTSACPWTRKVPVRGGWAVLAFCVATVAGGPAAEVLEGQRSGHGMPGSEACTFAFGGPRHPFGTLRGLSAHLHGVRLCGLVLCVRPASPEAPRVAWPVPRILDCAWLHPALWNQPPAQRAAHLPVFCFTVSWRCSLLFHILKI